MNKLFRQVDATVTLLGFHKPSLDAVLEKWVSSCHARALKLVEEERPQYPHHFIMEKMSLCYETWENTLREVEYHAIKQGRMDNWEEVCLDSWVHPDPPECTAESAELARQQDLVGCHFDWQ